MPQLWENRRIALSQLIYQLLPNAKVDLLIHAVTSAFALKQTKLNAIDWVEQAIFFFCRHLFLVTLSKPDYRSRLCLAEPCCHGNHLGILGCIIVIFQKPLQIYVFTLPRSTPHTTQKGEEARVINPLFEIPNFELFLISCHPF